jgi:hypothetical protein
VTPRYCPPEVARFILHKAAAPGAKVASTAQESFDAWSVGVMALELLDGGQHRVLAGVDSNEVLERVADPAYTSALHARVDALLRGSGGTEQTVRDVLKVGEQRHFTTCCCLVAKLPSWLVRAGPAAPGP